MSKPVWHRMPNQRAAFHIVASSYLKFQTSIPRSRVGCADPRRSLEKPSASSPDQGETAASSSQYFWDLWRIDTPIKCPDPDREDLVQKTFPPSLLVNSALSRERTGVLKVIEEAAHEIEISLSDLPCHCLGETAIVDFALCAPLENHFATPHDARTISGTALFMSEDALYHAEVGRPHLHSPISDLYACLWTCVYAALRGADEDVPSLELELLDMFFSRRETICHNIENELIRSQHASWTPVVYAVGQLDVFGLWKKRLDSILKLWIRGEVMLRKEESKYGAQRDTYAWELCFSKTVMQGLLALAQLVEENWEILRRRAALHS